MIGQLLLAAVHVNYWFSLHVVSCKANQFYLLVKISHVMYILWFLQSLSMVEYDDYASDHHKDQYDHYNKWPQESCYWFTVRASICDSACVYKAVCLSVYASVYIHSSWCCKLDAGLSIHHQHCCCIFTTCFVCPL